VTKRLALAVDGGNSKTDLALVTSDGEALALVRGPRSSPQYLGAEGCMEVIEGLLEQALIDSGVTRTSTPLVEIAALLLAGVDFPAEEQDVETALRARGWAVRTFVGNDTFAVLRAGTERGWGVAVVCGSALICMRLSPRALMCRDGWNPVGGLSLSPDLRAWPCSPHGAAWPQPAHP
jgi:N-acetylglucosamine kinase-like BadF-type ATPase